MAIRGAEVGGEIAADSGVVRGGLKRPRIDTDSATETDKQGELLSLREQFPLFLAVAQSASIRGVVEPTVARTEAYVTTVVAGTAAAFLAGISPACFT